jgi:hypothetical protein
MKIISKMAIGGEDVHLVVSYLLSHLTPLRPQDLEVKSIFLVYLRLPLLHEHEECGGFVKRPSS